MIFPPRWLRQRTLAIRRDEASFDRRGFADCDPRTRESLERAGGAVLDGYHAALAAEDGEQIGVSLAGIELEQRGFAYEGAAMALALLDRLAPRPPWRIGRWSEFQKGAGASHPYMLHVGAGLALARLKRRLRLPGKDFDPLLGWLVADGYGFHESYFHGSAASRSRDAAGRVEGYARRAFDQGLGRSLWFVCGGIADRIEREIAALLPERRPDLWSGVGLACAYAGGVERAGIEALRSRARPFLPEIAQGAAFAAQARARAGNPALHTEQACLVLCGRSAGEAAATTERALVDLPQDGPSPAYEAWRQRIQAVFRAQEPP